MGDESCDGSRSGPNEYREERGDILFNTDVEVLGKVIDVPRGTRNPSPNCEGAYYMQNTNDWVDRVSGVLMYLWNMQDFTATRWLTLGGVSKVVVRSLASGLHDIVSRALANPKNSKYYIFGWICKTQ